MLRDVFYFNKKPNVHPRERFAESLEDARQQCTTSHFWIINELCDYNAFDWDFDFEFLPDEDVWAEDHNNVWPSQHQKDSGTWLCPREHSDVIIYRSDVDPVKRRNEKHDAWVLLEPIHEFKFDFSWHPDPTSPPYIYRWGCKFFPAELKHFVEYVVPGATEVKYMNTIVELLPEQERWVEHQLIDRDCFDLSWRPDPMDPPFIYVWGNKWVDGKLKPTLEYHAPGATDKKYMPELLKVLPEWDRWEIIEPVDKSTFDFSWRPDPREPDLIYVFGNEQYDGNIMPTIEYRMPDAVDKKYVNELQFKAKLLPDPSKFEHLEDSYGIDYSWRPDPTSPPYIYAWGNQWNAPEDKVSIQYVVEGATEYKYMEERTTRRPNKSNWIIPNGIDDSNFDYSWEPNPNDAPYIYEFCTQWQKTGGPKYIVDGATETKYMNLFSVTKLLPDSNWEIPKNIDVTAFDFSWHPDATSPPYIYVFATQWALSGGPIYRAPGATEFKYIEDQQAIAIPDKTNWEYDPNLIDEASFDFSWHPYEDDDPFVYQFGTQWQKTGGPRYIAPGARSDSAIKYIDVRILKAIRLPSKDNWKILNDYLIADFDFSWHPDETEEPFIYVFGNTRYSAEEMPTIEYRVPGATQVKHVNDTVARLGVDMRCWQIPDNVDVTSFDFSWRPHPKSPPYIYQFGTQWQKTNGPRYVVEGATEVKYVSGSLAVMKPNRSSSNWKILNDCVIADFDYSWHPDETEEPYIYVFGNTQYSAEEMPTIEYRVPGATQKKYINDTVAKLDKNMNNWQIPDNVDVTSFDFSWQPHPKDSPYIYQFGTQWQKTNGPRYVVEGATEVKYVSGSLAVMKPNRSSSNWAVVDENAIVDFDYSWHPDETEEPYIYQFGTQWQKTGGPRYIVEGATEIKYTENPVAKRATSKNNWEIPESFDCSVFDFSWHPDETADPAIYQFGSVVGKDDGPRYVVPGNNKNVLFLQNIELTEDMSIPDSNEIPKYFIETTLEDLINNRPGEIFWAINKDLDYTNFDFDWRPDLYQSNYIHAFGSKENIDTQTYFVNSVIWDRGFKNINYVETDSITVKANLDMFYVDRGNPEARERFAVLKEQFPKIQKTRYLNSWVDTITRCTNRATSNLIWVLNSELDYSNFDFDYYPNPWQMKMVHVFGTQWSHWGTTFMVNREQFPIDTKYIKIVEHLSNLNFVKTKRAKATQCIYDVVVIDHGNPELDNVVKQITEKSNGKQVSTIKYDTSYLNTLRKIIKKQHEHKEHYLWLCSSVCDYSNFDFSYICDPFSKDQLHVFPSERQKFGDTFFVDVNKARELLDSMEVLADFHKVNYNSSMRVARLPAPEIVTSQDSLVDAIGQITNWPYAILTTEDNKNIDAVDVEPMSLWSLDSKNITITSTGATRIIAPREAKDHVKKELYDYPHIKKSARLAMSQPLDIVFLSNGEIGAEQNYEHLLNITKGLKNRVVRIDGVNGRVAAYHAAAEASNTPWAFTVFAKLKISAKFDWNWQPDRMQVPKHYIFQAKNPVNGLIYGHQAMIAYNKKLVLSNLGKGLDFTLDDEHEVVERMSGTAMYNTDAFSTWRTAFREVLKLRAEDTTDAKERLDVWLNKATGDFAEYSIKGALDADEYYDDVNGDFEKLKLSYEWDWLKKFFEKS